MSDQSEKCTAPVGCDKEQKTVAPFCRRHWYRIPIEIRKEIERCHKMLGTGFTGALRDDYFSWCDKGKEALAAATIGNHEISKCGNKKRKGCGEPIIWLTTRRGKFMPIEPDSVEPDDELYDHGRHVVHWATCPYADWFRESRDQES